MRAPTCRSPARRRLPAPGRGPVVARSGAAFMLAAVLAVATPIGGRAAPAAGHADGASVAPRVAARVEIDAAPGRDWQVAYHLPAPTRVLAFARSTDDQRVRTWRVPDAFELVRTGDREILRRRDGAEFTVASVAVPPRYAVLPKDYAPFSPFGDGGLAFHSGRLFACADACADDAQWDFVLRFSGWPTVLVGDVAAPGPARWRDAADGRTVYLGDAPTLVTPELTAVVDRALPPAIRDRLLADLPRLMREFERRLGALPARPTLFASYDASPHATWGQQGGTLPNQVFVHFYGTGWPAAMAAPGFAADLEWFFAHEAAHLYQRQVFGDTADAWLHEGGAEAFAALALMETSPDKAAFVGRRIAAARLGCTNTLAGRSIRDTLAAGAFDAAYTCGLLLSLAIDAGVRRSRPDADGLHAVWREFVARRTARAEPATADAVETFLGVVAELGGAPLAAFVRQAVTEPRPTLELEPGRVDEGSGGH